MLTAYKTGMLPSAGLKFDTMDPFLKLRKNKIKPPNKCGNCCKENE